MTSIQKTQLPIGLLIVSLAAACAREQATVETLAAQLEGRHCRFEWRWVSQESADRCVKARPDFSRILFMTGTERDCMCRGHAAACLGAMGPGARSAVADLTAYLESGPSDVDNGDGGSSCLSTAIEALGKIGDKKAIPALVTYLKLPRRVHPLAGALKPGRFAGLHEANRAIASFGEAAKEAIGPLRVSLERSEPEFISLRPSTLKTLQLLGDEEQIDNAERYLGRLEVFVSKPVRRHMNMILPELEDLHTVKATLEMLDEWAKVGNKRVGLRKPFLHRMLDLYRDRIPAWVKENIEAPRAKGAVVWGNEDGVENELKQTRRLIIRILARLRDSHVLHLLPEILDGIHRPEDCVSIVLGYGAQIDDLIPELIKLADDLQFGDRPLSETMDGRKFMRASTIIEILRLRRSEKAIRALEELGRNRHLRKEADRALISIRGDDNR